MRIRKAEKEDAEPIALLHAESWRTVYRGMFRDEFLDGDVISDRIKVWSQRLNFPKDNQLVLVAEEDHKILGFVCAFGNDDVKWGTFIDNLHVREDNKGCGIGRRLLKEAAYWSYNHFSDTGMFLWVLEPNTPARHFYEKLGAINQESKLKESPGGGVIVNLRYVWPTLKTIVT